MTETERADQFTRDVDALLHGETVSTSDDSTLLDLAQSLMVADFSAETDLDSLRPILPVRHQPQPKRIFVMISRPLRTLAVTATALVVLSVAVLTVPPLRAFAQELLGRIGFIQLTDAPTLHDELGTQESGDVEIVSSATPVILSPDEIAEKIGFALDTPQYLPDGFALLVNDGTENVKGTKIASRIYGRTGEDDSYTFLSFQQFKYTDETPEWHFAVGDSVIEDVTVNGLPAHLVIGYRNVFGNPSDILIWEQDGYVFWLTSNLSDHTEIIRIAESARYIETSMGQ